MDPALLGKMAKTAKSLGLVPFYWDPYASLCPHSAPCMLWNVSGTSVERYLSVKYRRLEVHHCGYHR